MLRISQNCTKSSNQGRKSYDENAGFEGRAVPDVVWSGPTFNPRALHGARPVRVCGFGGKAVYSQFFDKKEHQ